MNIVKYTSDVFGKTFNVAQALRDGWGLEWESEDALVGIQLQDRKKPSHTVTIKGVSWTLGIMVVLFEEGGWLCFDHAIEQFECVKIK